MEVSINKKWVN